MKLKKITINLNIWKIMFIFLKTLFKKRNFKWPHCSGDLLTLKSNISEALRRKLAKFDEDCFRLFFIFST